MIFHRSFLPGLAVASYLVGDETTRECAVIDPTRDVHDLVNLARTEGLKIRHILETHVHSDFVSGARELTACLEDPAQVHCSGLGGKQCTPAYADSIIEDGDEIQFGSIRLCAIHTPGHTVEHVMWGLFDMARSKDTPWLLFTGDFLLVGGVGGPDSTSHSEREELSHQLYQSVFERLRIFPDYTEVHPGRGRSETGCPLPGKGRYSRASSTLGYERRFNPALERLSEAEWVDKLLADMEPAPSYYRRMKEVNIAGPEIIGSRLPGCRALTAGAVQERMSENCNILDVRPKEAFATAHLPGAINIPLDANLAAWAARVLDYDRPTLLVVDDPLDVDEVVGQLLCVGFDDICGYLKGGLAAWEGHALKFGCLATIDVEQLHDQLTGPGHWVPFLLDVRARAEWASGHIDTASHIDCAHLKDRLLEVPQDRPVAVICCSGDRSTIAASLLQSRGYREISHVLGGMSAWSKRIRDH